MRKRSGRPPRFAAVPNETVDDAVNLDFMALGLLTVMIRHQDGWEITLNEIGDRYGYGRGAMAGAMGFLQVARYVVKVRIMSAEGNLWSTEVVVYDTPATDAEVSALLATIEREPDVRRAEVIEPTATAIEQARKRRAKLRKKRRRGPNIAVSRVSENPHSGLTCGNDEVNEVVPECRVSRQSGDPAVSKKTVEKKTEKTTAPAARAAGDARRATTGSSAHADAGGSAASDGAKAPKKSPRPRKASKGQARMTREQASAVATVEAAWPAELAALLPKNRPPELRDTILDALDGGRSPDQLTERVRRRWIAHGYADALLPDGKGIGSPVGVAVGLVRPSTDCPDPMCEDGVTIHLGGACPKCEQRRLDRKADHRQGQVPGPREDRQPAPDWWECENPACGAPGQGQRPEDGLCRSCRAELEQATARFGSESAHLEEAQRRQSEQLAWELLLEDAYEEHEQRETLAVAADHERRQHAEAAEDRRLREEIVRQHPELVPFGQGFLMPDRHATEVESGTATEQAATAPF